MIRWKRNPARGGTNRRFAGSNPSAGATIFYALPKKAEQVAVRVVDASGQTVREIAGAREAGLQQVTWDLMLFPGQGTNRGGSRAAQPPVATQARSDSSAQGSSTAEGGSGPSGARGSGRRRSGDTQGGEGPAATLGAPMASSSSVKEMRQPRKAERVLPTVQHLLSDEAGLVLG